MIILNIIAGIADMGPFGDIIYLSPILKTIPFFRELIDLPESRLHAISPHLGYKIDHLALVALH